MVSDVDQHPDERETLGTWAEAEPDRPPPDPWHEAVRGAIEGFRRSSYVMGPAAAMMLVSGLALIHFGIGTGHGFGLPDLLLHAVAFYVTLAAAGCLIGAAFGFRAGHRSRRKPAGPGPAWWQALNRPVGRKRHASVDKSDQADRVTGRPSLLDSVWTGGKTGWRWASYVLAPVMWSWFAGCAVLVSLGLGTLVPPGSRRLNELPELLAMAIGVPIVAVAFGFILGAPVGLVFGVIRWLLWKWIRRPGEPAARGRFRWLWRKVTLPSSKPRPTGGQRRRWPYLIGIPVQLLMMGALAAGVYAAWRVHQRLEEAMAVAEIDDPSWRLDDHLAHREPVPYTENAAVVVAEALELIPAKWPPPAPPAGRPPQTSEEELGAAFSRLGSMPENLRLDETTAGSIEAEVDRLREAIQIARTLVHYDRGRHGLMIGPTVIDTQLPETQATRNATRLLCLDSALRADRGDLDGALESCRASVVAGRSIGDEPFMISQLVRIAIGSYTMQATRRVLGQGVPSDAALASLQSLILDERDQPLLLYAVRGERAQMDELIRRIRDGEIPIEALSNERWKPDGSDTRFTVAPWARLNFDNQRALELELLNDAVAIAESPPDERPSMWQAWDQRIQSLRRQWHSSVTSDFAILMTPALRAGGLAHARWQAELGAMAILLAAERHRQRTGAWPASVAAIDVSLLPDSPLDPFTGQPYHIEHRDGRLFVYSVGPNLRDEHGDYNYRKWGTKFANQDDVGAIGWDVELRGLMAVEEDDEESGDSAAR